MKYVYLKPELDNLSQGERIAFARQTRRMSQDEVSDKLGLTGESKRRTMARYERGTGRYRKVDCWSRVCKKCGKKEYTYEMEKVPVKTVSRPKFK